MLGDGEGLEVGELGEVEVETWRGWELEMVNTEIPEFTIENGFLRFTGI